MATEARVLKAREDSIPLAKDKGRAWVVAVRMASGFLTVPGRGMTAVLPAQERVREKATVLVRPKKGLRREDRRPSDVPKRACGSVHRRRRSRIINGGP